MKHLATLTFLLFSLAIFAQPINDDCSGLIDLGPAPICPSPGIYNNVGALESAIGFDNFPGCFVGNPQRDVWFAFTAVDTILDYRITVTGVFDSTQSIASMVNPQIAVYRGDCVFDGLELLECVTSDNGETEVYLELSGLTPGIPYYLRINDWSSSGTPNQGAFKLCIEKKPPVTTIDQGSSTLCSGTLCDSGGADGDYGNDENYVFTICPTAPHNCINFTLQYYNLDFSDNLIFYDGANVNSPVIAQVNGNDEVSFEDWDFLLNPNVTNAGGACFTVAASSGCLTIEFNSDATAEYEGFCGTWECTAEECQPSASIDVNTDATPEEMVESVVAGQTTVTITNIDCPNGAMGTFESADNSDLGLKKGLLLTSGHASDAALPGSFQSSYGNNGAGDPELDYLSTINGNGITSNDACIVEMDVFAATDEITFEYVFGSEEYPEYAYTTFNDIFAFLVSGPGIVGDPNINNQLNIATLPNGTFVQINSVNYQENWNYYRDNVNGQSVVYDGMTTDSAGVKKSLTARVATIPCNTYHLKFAIADRGDFAFDSGVFISEIKGGSPNLGVNYFSGIDYLVEECTNIPDEITVSLDNPVPTVTTFGVEVSGTATLGVDYTLTIPTTLTFATGTEVFNFPIQAITDNIPEGVETIVISLTRDFGCGVVTLAELTVNLHDNLQVDIFKDEIDTAFVCQGSCIQLKAIGAQNYFWQPPGLMSDPNISNPIACPDTSLWVSVLGTLGICSDQDSIYLLLVNPEVQIQPDTSQLSVCPGDTVSLFAQNNVGNSNLIWNGFIDPPLVDPTNPMQVFVPNPIFGSFFLQVQVELGGCTAFDDILIGIDNLQLPVVANDTLICQNYPVDLGVEPQFNNGTTYSWTPDYNLDPGADAAGPIATPDQTTTYTLIATGPLGLCKDTAEVTIEVVPADVEILNPDTAFICIGDTVALISTSTTNGVGQTWYPQVFMNQIEPGVVEVSPPVSTWYFTKLVVGACTIVDSVLVYVDSLPGLEIVPEPNKPSYCQGEEIKLISPTYEPANFPGIDLEWINPLPGALTPDSFLNLVFIALEDHTYLRRVTVHGCTRIDSIFIDVVPVASMQVIPAIDTICPGESVQFSIEAEPGVTDFMWSPPTGLSCTDCENPIATPPGTTTYNVEGEFEGCPVGASATIIVLPLPQYQFPAPFACPGTNVTLNLLPDPTATYSWTSSDGSVTSNEAAPVATPFVTTTFFMTASNDGCEVEDQFTLVVPEDFTLTVQPDAQVCFNEALTLTATASQPNVIFTWTDLNGNAVNFPQLPPMGGSYFVSASDPANCYTHTGSVSVEVFPDFTLTASNDTTVQAGEPVTLVASADLAGVTFVWTDPFGAQISTGASVTVTNCKTSVYTVTANHPDGCQSKSEQVTVTALAGFSVDAVNVMEVEDPDTLIYEGEKIELTVTTDPPVLPGAEYKWFIDNVLVATTNDTTSGVLIAPEVGRDSTFRFSVEITNDNGCSAGDFKDQLVKNNPVQLPNIFTPNNDSVNDTFKPISVVPVVIDEFKVWNRWGQLVYDNQNGNEGWDGMQDGEPAASDVYVYHIIWHVGESQTQASEKGDVTLVR